MIQFTAFQVICTFYYAAALYRRSVYSCFFYSRVCFLLSVCELRQCAQRRHLDECEQKRIHDVRIELRKCLRCIKTILSNVGTIFSLDATVGCVNDVVKQFHMPICIRLIEMEFVYLLHWIQVRLFIEAIQYAANSNICQVVLCAKHWTRKNTQWCLLTLQKTKILWKFSKLKVRRLDFFPPPSTTIFNCDYWVTQHSNLS